MSHPLGESNDSLFFDDDEKKEASGHGSSSEGEGDDGSDGSGSGSEGDDGSDGSQSGSESSSYEGSSGSTTGSDEESESASGSRSSHSTNELQDDDSEDYGNHKKNPVVPKEAPIQNDNLGTATEANIDAFLNDTDDTGNPPDEAKVAATVPPVPSSSSSPDDDQDVSLLILISRQSLDRKVQQDQQNAMAILDSKGIPYATMDGADPGHKDERNKLFQLSGLGAAYPQFFLVRHGNEKSFYGDMDLFVQANEEGWLAEDLGITTAPPAPQVLPNNVMPPAKPKVPFLKSNAEEILSRPTPAEQQKEAMLVTSSLHEQNKEPLFTGKEEETEKSLNVMSSKDIEEEGNQDDGEEEKEKDATTPPTPKPSIVQTVVQLWGNMSSSSSASKEKASTTPRDLPEDLPHVKGIVDDRETAMAKDAQAKAEHDRMVRHMKEQSEQKRAEREARRQQRIEEGGEEYSSDEDGDEENGVRHESSHNDGEDPSEFEDEGQHGVDDDTQNSKKELKKGPWASLRNLFGRGKKKEQEPVPEEQEKQDPLSLGQGWEDDDDEEEDQLFDQQERGNLPDHKEQKQQHDDPFSDNSSSHRSGDENKPKEETKQPQQIEQQLVLANFKEPFLDDDQDRDRANDDDDEEEDAGSKNSQHQQHDDTQRDTSEAEPFLDEEQGLEEQGYGQPGMNDTNDRDVVQQEKQTPCTVYVVALLIGEVVGVAIGWYVWAR
uniref:Glutaredoxin domain-containing protein n=1 Tax=Amphora coffeiformis TaxID=265554 RepID=A0A7S3P7Z9_9STRA